MRQTACAALVSALAGTALCAAPLQGAERRDRDRMREEIQETVEIYMIARMKRVLELDDEQSRTIIPLMEELNASRRDFGRRRREIVMRLRPLVEMGGDDREISDLLERLYEIERSHRETEAKIHAEIRGSLTPIQQARFLFFQERFRREMEERLRGLMQGQGRQRPGGARPRPRR